MAGHVTLGVTKTQTEGKQTQTKANRPRKW